MRIRCECGIFIRDDKLEEHHASGSCPHLNPTTTPPPSASREYQAANMRAWRARNGPRHVCAECGGPKVNKAGLYCRACYRKAKPERVDPLERLLAMVDPQSNGCWHWRGRVDELGYGHFHMRPGRGGHNYKAHRASYELLVGPIPDGLQIDHVCHNRDQMCAGGVGCLHRRCVNPDHLEPVTRIVNVRRGVKLRQTHCVHGHEYTPENTYHPGGNRNRRECRTCISERRRKKAS